MLNDSSQQGDHRFSGPPPDQGASDEAQARDGRVPEDSWTAHEELVSGFQALIGSGRWWQGSNWHPLEQGYSKYKKPAH
ncbi:hypothetical protein PoB_003524800 [Plakobranchus ocellatus]|uniref:Uncharacterized protein n=1 Tax=Plakobranchus ocellatus TaxID=259542 RepID=A0AAV4AQ97_9GAST|nr:hypothetical protein PoB_003524800 [Plakobranchus ocellatus]